MNTLSMARRKKELTPNQKLAQAIIELNITVRQSR